jgi:sterol desaturase/sphingolipid hydroxylase (fatty acid hydroxylase superfamily)
VRLEDISLPAAYAFTAAGFASIYFGVGAATAYFTGSLFPALRIGRALGGEARAGQRRKEIFNSLVSIAIFGFYGVATVVLARAGLIEVDWQPRLLPLLPELAFLVLWNELHFYAFHRLLHTRWLYRKVHIVHHRSVPPTPFATYSFHWVESTLLGSVMLFVQPFHAFNVLTLVLFPLVSITLNNIGHMSYDLAAGRSTWHPLAASRRHSQHHHRVAGNFGFLLPVFDWLFRTNLPE